MPDAQSPYLPPVDSFGAPPPRKSTLWIWLLVALLASVGLLVCCGGGTGLVWFGMGIVAEEVANELRDHPVIQEQLGGIDEIKVDFTASAATKDDDEFVYDVSGPKGSGTLTCRTTTDEDGNEVVLSGSLRTAKGTFEIIPE